MTPGARLQAAMEIVDRFIEDGAALADPLLRDWARGARYAGSKDRAAVADIVFASLRRLGSATLGDAAPRGRGAVLGALRLEGSAVEALAALADGGPHRPDPLNDEEKARLERLPEAAAAAPLADFPEWLRPALADSVADPVAEIAALARRAAFDLRVNTLKTDLAGAARALAEDGLETEPGPLAPTALRVAGLGGAGRPKLSGLGAYAQGLVEPQDAASQAAALLAAALFPEKAGLALDACAGGGGKTLALAAALPGSARLCAFDIAAKRMAGLPERLSRAGARAEVLDRAGLATIAGQADLVLVDAPCSGSGAWARQPDAKWRLTPGRLQALRDMQAEALDLGAAAVGPGGALVYVTCSLLAAENVESVLAFLTRRSEFEPAPLGPAWAAAGLRAAFECDPKGALGPATVQFSPAKHGADGFFVAALRRRGGR